MATIRTAAFAWLLIVPSAAALAQATSTDQLDTLLKGNRTIELAQILQSNVVSPSAKLEWLKRRAAEGHVIAQYELANELVVRDKTQALNWYAKARLGRIVDAAECKDERRAENLGALVDAGYMNLQELADANEELYANAIEKALRDDAVRSDRVPPYWICAPGEDNEDEASLLPLVERKNKREAARNFLVTRGQTRVLEARMNANLNPDRFEVRTIAKGLMGDHDSRSMVWVDDDVLLFGAHERSDREDLYSWDMRANELRKVADSAGGPCSYRGFVSYSIKRDGQWFRREGKFGEEVENPVRRGVDYITFRCRLIPQAEWPYKWPQKALDGGGVLEFHPNDSGRTLPLRFYPQGSKTPIDLPFSYADMLGSISYSEYLGAHWLTRHTGLTSETQPGRIWVIYANGRVDTIDTPAGPWVSVLGNYPAKGGWVFRNYHGVYFWSRSEVRKILYGFAVDAAVSPNGCRVAVKIGPPKAVGYLDHGFKIIDLCNRGGRQ